MKLRRPSPALVISCIALVAACAGTAYARTIITSSAQIKNGAVASADIRNGTIQGADIRNGTITANKLKTASAAGGATTAYHASRRAGPEGQPANVVVKIMSLTVPAGAYHVIASTVMTALPGAQNPLLPERDSPSGRCRLDVAGDEATSLQNVVVESKSTPSTLFMQATRTVGGPSEFFLECSAGSSFRLSESSIVATKVSDVQLTAVP